MPIWWQESPVVQSWAGWQFTQASTGVRVRGLIFPPRRERCAPAGGCTLLTTSDFWNLLFLVLPGTGTTHHTAISSVQMGCQGSPRHLRQRVSSEKVAEGLMAWSTRADAFSTLSRHLAASDLSVVFLYYPLQECHQLGKNCSYSESLSVSYVFWWKIFWLEKIPIGWNRGVQKS